MNTKQWETRAYLPGLIIFLVAMYVVAFLLYHNVRKHENRNGKPNQPVQHKGGR